MDVLEEWNRKVGLSALPDHSELYYRQNIFIYNSLLHCIRADSSKNALPHLYQWFSVTRGAKNRPLGIKPQKTAMKDEEWDVRNTFKSNMPSEYSLLHLGSIATGGDSSGATSPGSKTTRKTRKSTPPRARTGKRKERTSLTKGYSRLSTKW